MEQVSHHVRGITGVRESRLSQGAFLRAEVQGAESGQDTGGLLHQAVRLPCAVPCHRHELQSGREGTTHPFLGEESDGIALQVREMHHRPCEGEPSDCRIIKGNGGEVATSANP